MGIDGKIFLEEFPCSQKGTQRGFPDGTVVKNPPANEGVTG